MAQTIHVIPHTHWDFEWYFTHPESSVQLVYHMDDLLHALQSGEVQHYILDGQMSIVEDYLKLAPQKRAELQHWVTSGKLSIGPWYTHTDQFVISGESIVRNLLLGNRCAQQLGGSWMMGYVPDAFGQSIDMPKIYSGFNIKYSVFWRGLSKSKYPYREFNWRSEDGSQVQCYQIRNGYYLAEPQIAGMPADAIVDMVQQDTRSTHLPMPFGADQIKVDQTLSARVSAYNQSSAAGHHFIQSTYDELFRGINADGLELDTIEGEMLDAQFSKIHRSIYSTRYDHKQLNDAIETRLTMVLEPLMLLARNYGVPYKQQLVNETWKQLLRCHAHDSAGGCNSDRTNAQILQRLIQTEQMSGASVDFLLRKLSESAAPAQQGSNVVMYNTLPYKRRESMRVALDTLASDFTLYDEQGNAVAYSVLSSERRYRGSIRRSVSEQDDELYYYHHEVEFFGEVPALGLCCYTLQDGQASPVAVVAASSDCASISCRNCQISFAAGTLNLVEQETGTHWPDFLLVRDMGDDGDNYDYSQPENDWILSLNFAAATVSVQTTPYSQTMTLTGEWLVPEDLMARAQHKATTSIAYQLTLTLTDDKPLDIALSIDNQASDHRMQLVVNSDVVSSDNIADTPFGTVVRPNVQAELANWHELGWKEEPSCIYPMLHHVSLRDEAKALTLLSCGIKEYEVLQPVQPHANGASGQLALTLFRSVGWLGKPDLLRRPGIASGQQFKYIATPDSQLQQTLTFKAGLLLRRTYHAAHIMQTWQRFAVPCLSYQQQELNRFTNTMKYFGVNALPQALPAHGSLLKIEAPELICSALKLAESTDASSEAVIIRVYNSASDAIADAGYIELTSAVKKATLVNLNEEEIAAASTSDKRLNLGDFAPKQIKTFRLE